MRGPHVTLNTSKSKHFVLEYVFNSSMQICVKNGGIFSKGFLAKFTVNTSKKNLNKPNSN